MTDTFEFSDEQLTAYLDHEGDSQTAIAIAKALQTNAALQQRVQALQMPIDGLRHAFAGLLPSAPAMPKLPEKKARFVAPGRLKMLSAMAACAVFGVFLGTGLSQWRSTSPDWKDYVAAYQALYVPQTLASIAIPDQAATGNLAPEITSLSQVLGHDLRPATQDAVLQFKRGQILGYQGRPLVQLAYLSPKGDPVALCIIRLADQQPSNITYTKLEGMAAAHWQKDGLGYLLIGGTDQTLISKVAKHMQTRL